MALDWSTVATEGGRGLLFLGLAAYLRLEGQRRGLADKPGWTAILWGFVLLVAQAALVVANQHPALQWDEVVVGLSLRQFLYNTLLPIIGAAVVLYGFGKFLVYPARLANAQQALERANEHLKERIAEATAGLKASNQALTSERASLALFRDLLDQSNDAILIMDTDEGRFQDVNLTACDRLGYTRQELLQCRILDIVPLLADQQAWRTQVRDLQQGPLTQEEVHRCKDGTLVPVEVTVQQMSHEGQDYIVAIARDITERTTALEEARAHMEMLQTLFEASPEPIIALDVEGRVVLWNPAAEAAFGWSADEVLGKQVPTLPSDDVAFEQALHHARRGERFQAQAVPRCTRKGEVRRFNISVAPLRDTSGAPVGSIKVLTDVTAQLEVEASKRRALEVEKEVEHLRDMDRFKTRFLNTAAHELATPLTPVRFQLRALREGLLGELEPGQGEAVSIVERNVLRLERLVGDLLDSTRLQGGRLKIEPRQVQLSGLLEEVTQDFQPLMAEAGLHLETSIAPALVANVDPDRVGQVVANLLDNAIKYTPSGGSVQLTGGPADGGIRIEVQDDGVGLEPEQTSEVFEPFTQLHRSRDRPREGTGLGLYIARGIVEQHGGTMGARSDGPGQGTTFWLAFPEDASPEPPSGTQGAGEAPA